MADAVEPRTSLVIRVNDVPGCVLRVRGLEHHIPRPRVFEPFAPRAQVHGAELPLAQRILDAGLEAALLLLVANLQPEFDELNTVATMYSSNSGQTLRKRWCCSFVQNPITYSTPARLYQLRSKITTSPAAGNCCM